MVMASARRDDTPLLRPFGGMPSVDGLEHYSYLRIEIMPMSHLQLQRRNVERRRTLNGILRNPLHVLRVAARSVLNDRKRSTVPLATTRGRRKEERLSVVSCLERSRSMRV
jgi:hypothetical protein